MALPLLQTKLYTPPLRPKLVQRAHLLARLHGGTRQRLTLVSAPAGFGKTTLVSAWASQAEHPVAWLSLADDDNDPFHYFTYLIAALQTCHPGLGETVLTLIAEPQPPPLNVLLTLLLNELSAHQTPLTLVLDDYHLITAQPLHEAMTFFINHLPPHLHLVIATRLDPPLPLARWRVRNQLTEIRAAELRFLPAEATNFLNDVMGLRLTAAQIATLETRTEGWIAGLQLAALALQGTLALQGAPSLPGRDDVASFLQAFSGSHRHVLSYLVEEVLNRCPADMLDFLLQTAILDRFSAPLCATVTGRSDSQQLLEQIEQANLFLTPLDNARQWYRYHPLFTDVLRQQLPQRFSAAAVADLHRRASIWYKEAELLDEAIQHALAAQAFAQAATLVEQVALALILRGEFARLRSWLETLPAEEVQTRPLLTLYHVWVLYIDGQRHQAAVRLEAVEAMLAADETKRTPEVQGLIAITQTRLLREAGDLAGAIAIARQALANLPTQATMLRARITLNLAIAYYLQGDLSAAAQQLTESLTTGQTAQLIGPMPTIYLKAQILRAQGKLQQALQLCLEGVELVARHNWQDLPATGFLYVAIGDLLRERNQLDAAADYLERGIRLGQTGDNHHILIIGHVWLAWLRQTEGNAIGSQEAIRTALQLLQQHAVSRFWPLPSATCTQARLWIAQGNLATANHWAQTNHLHTPHTPIPYLDEAGYLTLARLRIAEGKLAVAESLLRELHQTAAAAGRNGSLIEILILQAVTYAAQQQREQARSVLAQALTLAGGLLSEEGYVRLFVDEGAALRLLLLDFQFWIAQQPNSEQNIKLSVYVDKLLAAFGNVQANAGEGLLVEPSTIQNQKSKSKNLIEPLSERELEVLRLVATGFSNSQIAARLIVTTGTVKTHINHIFGKLGVQSRTQAVARAHEFGLLTD